MLDGKTRRDLEALDVTFDPPSQESEAHIVQLGWLEQPGVMDKLLDCISEELTSEQEPPPDSEAEDEPPAKFGMRKGESPAQREFRNKSDLIDSLRRSGMRREDHSLTSVFLEFYRVFCLYDGGSKLIRYSPAAIERGDHPCWPSSVTNEQRPDETAEMDASDAPAEEPRARLDDSTPPARVGGGANKGRNPYNVVVDGLIEIILSRTPKIFPQDAWAQFASMAPNWSEILDLGEKFSHVEFEPIEPRHGEGYLRMNYRNSKNSQKSEDFTIENFKRRLRNWRKRIN